VSATHLSTACSLSIVDTRQGGPANPPRAFFHTAPRTRARPPAARVEHTPEGTFSGRTIRRQELGEAQPAAQRSPSESVSAAFACEGPPLTARCGRGPGPAGLPPSPACPGRTDARRADFAGSPLPVLCEAAKAAAPALVPRLPNWVAGSLPLCHDVPVRNNKGQGRSVLWDTR
jgi:hypothetical protein